MQKKKEINKKKILFVINTMGRAGAERALLELLRQMDGSCADIYLYVLTGQGELIEELPDYVKLLNQDYQPADVLSPAGARILHRRMLRQIFHQGAVFRNFFKIIKNGSAMLLAHRLRLDKLLWRTLSDSAPRPRRVFDLAVAYLEGGATYYVADHVRARRKAAFVHIDYVHAGYNKKLDEGCYQRFQRIFCVSDEVRDRFLAVYPEYGQKTFVFHNIVNRDLILSKALEGQGFEDDFSGIRILSVGRLTYQKAYDLAVQVMARLKKQGIRIRWYALGDGDYRPQLERQIKEAGLTEDFLLLGSVDNPYPYFAQCDLYVHASRYEGKSIAIQEAQVLGCTILATDCSGNREQIENGRDGILCPLSVEGITEGILYLLSHPEEARGMGLEAAKKVTGSGKQLTLLSDLLGE